MSERKDLYLKVGWSTALFEEKLKRGEKIEEEVIERLREVELQIRQKVYKTVSTI